MERVMPYGNSLLFKIGLSMDDFVYENSGFWYKDTVEFCGHTFRMRITPYRTNMENRDKDLVQGIGYVLRYTGDPEGAASAAIELRNALKKGEGQLVRTNPQGNGKNPQLLDIERGELETNFKGESWAAGLTWILSTDMDAIPVEVMEEQAPTCISLRYWIGYPDEGEEIKDDKGTVSITLDYGLTMDYIASNYD